MGGWGGGGGGGASDYTNTLILDMSPLKDYITLHISVHACKKLTHTHTHTHSLYFTAKNSTSV